MKNLKHGKVILLAAAIILACAGMLVTVLLIVFDAMGSKVVAEQQENTAAVSALPETQKSAVVAKNNIIDQSGDAATALAEPDAQYISEEDAIAIFTELMDNLFEITVDTQSVNVTLDILPPGATWIVTFDGYLCCIDAISGDVITCDSDTKTYSGKWLPFGQLEKDPYYQTLEDNPDNVYIQTVREIVNSHLADGRSIDHIEIHGVQFIFLNEDSLDINTPAMAAVAVDCGVYMDTGLSYTIGVWGNESDLQIYRFFSHQSWDACKYGYYYEEYVENYLEEFPEGAA